MSNREIAEELYGAFEARDPGRLAALLHETFHGEVTPGLPRDWGGTYVGAEAMLRECWAQVFSELDTRPVPAEMIEAADGRIVVIGHYRGSGRKSGNPHEAVFAHVLSFEDGRIRALQQITDSQRWHEALGPAD